MAEDVVKNEVEATVEIDTSKVYAQLTKEDDTYFVTDETHGKQECKFDKTGEWLVIPANDANRHYVAKAKLDKAFEENGVMDLLYKATKVIGPQGSRLPNANLIKYLSEEDQAEYAAIIDRARAAKAADKKMPASKVDQLKAKLAKLEAQLAALNEEEA